MRLYIRHALSGDYVYFVESYRDPLSKKPRSRIVKSFGRLDALVKDDPDVLQHLSEELSRVNGEVAAVSVRDELDEFFKRSSSSDSYAGMPVLNYGILVYRHLWDELELDEALRLVGDSPVPALRLRKCAFLMSALRNMAPCSKLATFIRRDDYLFDFEDVREHDMYNSLSLLAAHKKSIERHLYRKLHSREVGDASVAFYDVTTYYFESVSADGFKAFGFSKDHRVNEVQVVMGLLIDSDGMPLGYELYPGSTSEFKTLYPALRKLRDAYGVKRVIVTADRGLNSKSNLAMIKKLGYEYIMAFKLRGASADVMQKVLDEDGYTYGKREEENCAEGGSDIDNVYKYKTIDHVEVAASDNKTVALVDRLIVNYSPKRAAKDRKDRERLIRKAEKLIANPSQFRAELKKGGKSFVIADVAQEKLELDREKIARQSMLDGYYGIICSDGGTSPEEAVSIHHKLWKIEESFRVMKSTLNARPCYVWTEASIRGHFVICYLALVMQRLLERKARENKIEASTQEIIDAVKKANVTAVNTGSRTIYVKHENSALYEDISQMLGMSQLKSYSTRKDIQAVLHKKIPL